MTTTSRSPLLAAAALTGTLALAGAISGYGAATPKPAPSTMTPRKKAVEVYKNIQVLKDIDANELIPTMQFMVDSLGLECASCHVPGGSDKDDKPLKGEARRMILMTRAINKANYDGNVTITCFACHRGAEFPVVAPLITDAESKRTPPVAPPSNAPTAQQILDKYSEATGGPAAIQKITSQVERGNLLSGDGKTPVEIYVKAPNKRVTVEHFPNGDWLSVFDGAGGWVENKAPSPPGRELTASETANARLDADMLFAPNLSQVLQDLRLLPPEKIDDRDMVVVSGQPKGLNRVKLYFDPQTGLLARMLRYNETPLGRTPVRIDYSDYRVVDGLKLPFRWTVARPGGASTFQMDSVEFNVSVDDSHFARPPALASGGK